tara:strand:+ start:3460 stop:4236 length:777 start_codon:yes stop_codon:yes gene_type:complete
MKKAKETTKVVKEQPAKKSNWEVKDRLYELVGDSTPIVHIIRSRNMYWFDEELGYEREMKYCKNQRTVFVEDMKGQQRLSHIVFRDGRLFVPKEEQTLQKLLSLYHPDRNKVYAEFNPVKEAEDDLSILEFEIEALNIAREIDIDQAEAILRTDIGNAVSSMTSKEVKRDVLLFAKNNPTLFLDLVQDENIELRNVGIKAVEGGIIKLSPDNRTFTWASNDKKLLTVPFEENPYSALAAWFKTDDGMDVFKSVEKRLK